MGDYNQQYLDDEDQDYNNRYENIPTPVDGEELKSSDEESEEKEEEEDDEDEEGTLSEDDEIDRTLQDKNFDPYESWDALMEIDINVNIMALLMDDEELQEVWAKNQAGAEDQEAEEEEYDDAYESEVDDEEEDEELQEIIPSDSDEELPPVEVGDSENIYELSSDEYQEEDAFSFGDAASEKDLEEDDDVGYKEDDEDKEEQDENEEEDKENKEPEKEEEVKTTKRYRRLEKYNDSDTSEYETITSVSESEKETNQADNVDDEEKGENKEEGNETVEQIVKDQNIEKLPSPDPYPWIEYEKEIEYIEEYDGNFMENYMAQNQQTSARSSTDESNDEKDTYDLPVFQLPPSELSVVKNKHANKNTTDSNRKKARIIPSERIRTTSGQKRRVEKKEKIDQVSKTKELVGYRSYTGKAKFKYEIDLNVYNFDNYPQYECDEKDDKKTLIVNKKKKNNKKIKDNNNNTTNNKKYRDKFGRKYLFLKRKQRTKCYKRVHPEYNDNKEEDSDAPDEDIPVYKAKMAVLAYRNKTVELVLDSLLTQTFTSIEKVDKARLRKEATHHSRAILLDICENIVEDIEEKQQKDAVSYAIELLLDSWEQHVYRTRMKLIDEQLDNISEAVVTTSVRTAVDEIVDEDIYATLYVRDTLAELLNEFGLRQAKINRKLGGLFSEYHFDSYDFEGGGTTKKIKKKVYKPRKELDSYLNERLKKIKLKEDEEERGREAIKLKQQKEREKKEKEEELREDMKRAVLEKKKSFYPKNSTDEIQKDKEEEEESLEEEKGVQDLELIDRNGRNNVDVSPEDSEVEVTGELRDTHELFDSEEIAQIAVRARRRGKVVALWRQEDKNLLEELRKVSDNEADYTESEEENNGEEDGKVNLNKIYAEELAEEEEQKNEDYDFKEYYLRKLPNLQKEVEKALKRSHTPTKINLVTLTKDKERNDSAIGSTNHGSPTQRTSVGLRRHESGISSILSNELREQISEEMEQLAYEQEKPLEEIVKMIPKIDRDQYLQSWLYNGSPKVFNHAPSPPGCQNNKKVRRPHLKRPKTAQSDASIMDIIPLEIRAFKNTDYENNNERPGTSSSYYTGRETAFSKRDELDEDEDDSEDSGNDQEVIKPEKPRKKPPIVKKNIKIEFKQPERPKESKRESDLGPAWQFYVRQKRIRKEKKEYGTEHPVGEESVIWVPPKDLYIEERDEILMNCPAPLKEVFEDEEDFDVEILQATGNTSDSENGYEEERVVPSVVPPATPWQREKERPPTPDSYDSEEELEELKRNYISKHRRNRENEKLKHLPDRKWKEYLKRKNQPRQQPPPVRSGWKASPGIIPWKNAREDARRQQKSGANAQEVQANVNRELFQKLQIMARRDQNFYQGQNNRLLQRRKTMHNTDSNTRKKETEKQKLLHPDQSYGKERSPPQTTRSTPSYLRPTKAAENKYRQRSNPDQLPSISNPVSAAPRSRGSTNNNNSRSRKTSKAM
ncbi:myb-like protein X [Hydractinia symbiolongicarpus]|uniref:myb-like protein X n=1 Tax=Hydractinia symbiolongicarpus TaxID=13093 RepID=UPI00254BF3F1|nr:myb-like protein X [Hydractinia symbiolongicarpus]XP_057307775.1 myb-like protein X [Hydractinia symbiolongicarpus]